MMWCVLVSLTLHPNIERTKVPSSGPLLLHTIASFSAAHIAVRVPLFTSPIYSVPAVPT